MLLIFLIVLAALTLLYFATIFFLSGGFRKKNEPPIIRGVLPYLGVGLEINKNPKKYLFELQEKFADDSVVTLFMAGKRMHYFLNPLDYAKVYAAKKTVDFDPMMEEFLWTIFGSSKPYNHTISTGTLAKQWHAIVASQLQGDALVDLTTKVQTRIQHHLFSMYDWSEWQEVPLAQFLAKLIYLAASDSIMYPGFQVERDFDKFKVFDQMFPLFASGLAPAFVLKEATKCRNELSAKFDTADFEKCSDIIRARNQLLNGVGALDDVSKSHFGFFWAANSNTMIATFWAIIYLIHQAPETKAKIHEEMQAIVHELQQAQGVTSTSQQDELPSFTPDALQKMKYLDSCISETFRYTSSVSSFRRVVEDTQITLENGKTFLFRKGDDIVLHAYLVNHDPDIYDNPSQFQVDRYMTNTKFTKNQKPVPSVITPFLFGGGLNVCPGRFFAKNEMRLVAALMMNYMDIELVDKEIPEAKKVAGAGLNPPEHDVRIKMKIKPQFKNMLNKERK